MLPTLGPSLRRRIAGLLACTETARGADRIGLCWTNRRHSAVDSAIADAAKAAAWDFFPVNLAGLCARYGVLVQIIDLAYAVHDNLRFASKQRSL
ncbi:hypothetical protein OG585_22390 [Streptomyces sp. NBC_01340]|uniref:hypothetical protein n=1 Tax=unclassified Streptomyces TaxID=2593676 RepID=UPI00224D30F6|nr:MULTISPECIES: hypothetical protein [unclassified Streptomyces]MCX4455359.1 hypothetical protein [Streptomyces sp. NBC_01719]MCX4494719.1 hypothetical protein [Streptomyces sp. NBC_01728]MCX4590718.1 hypothetical protein [Streptomyces sp. NBC_01549]WSI39746.1 hypothetical protein OG585_22390 [Streptomyces sp. NBC_01340]